MATYVILNLIVLVVCSLLLVRWLRVHSRASLITLAALLALTLMFDSLMIVFGFFRYAPELILGIYVGKAPIEDLFYALLAVLIIPPIWHSLESTYVTKS